VTRGLRRTGTGVRATARATRRRRLMAVVLMMAVMFFLVMVDVFMTAIVIALVMRVLLFVFAHVRCS